MPRGRVKQRPGQHQRAEARQANGGRMPRGRVKQRPGQHQRAEARPQTRAGIDAFREGRGRPRPESRTFARGILPLTHSDADGALPSWLRLSAYAGSRGTGGPSPPGWTATEAPWASARPGGPGQHQRAEARQANGGRMPRGRVKQRPGQHQRAEARQANGGRMPRGRVKQRVIRLFPPRRVRASRGRGSPRGPGAPARRLPRADRRHRRCPHPAPRAWLGGRGPARSAFR